MANSRNPFSDETRSRAERLSIATRSGSNSSIVRLMAIRWSSSGVASGYRQWITSLPASSAGPKSTPQPEAFRISCSRLSSNANNTVRSPEAIPPARNWVVRSVLPVPVGPEMRMIESRKNPPPHIASSSGVPELIRTADDFCSSARADSGITTIPCPGTIVNGHSPFW